MFRGGAARPGLEALARLEPLASKSGLPDDTQWGPRATTQGGQRGHGLGYRGLGFSLYRVLGLGLSASPVGPLGRQLPAFSLPALPGAPSSRLHHGAHFSQLSVLGVGTVALIPKSMPACGGPLAEDSEFPGLRLPSDQERVLLASQAVLLGHVEPPIALRLGHKPYVPGRRRSGNLLIRSPL